MRPPPFATTVRRPQRRLPAWLDSRVAALYPGYFALVMATGIISNALIRESRELSDLMFLVAAGAYPWLALLTLARAVRYPRAIWADLTNPRVVFAFFTIVAASDVLGMGMHLRGFEAVAFGLWLFALVAWVVLIYFSFGVLTFLNTAHGANVVHGGWLIAIVGTESLVILGAFVAPLTGGLAPSVFVLIHMLWGIGLVLYAIFVTLFAYRIFFFDIGPDDITPLLWVVMGAAAISTNAGSTLILTDSGMEFLRAMRPFMDGVTLIMWAWATWWIPLLLLFGIWKHGVCGVPISYSPMLWSLVFPLGMYSLASLRLSLAADFAPLRVISQGMVWVSVAVWAVTLAGLVVACWRSYREFRPGAP
jgi:tellurite resistance protein TehA-like permease